MTCWVRSSARVGKVEARVLAGGPLLVDEVAQCIDEPVGILESVRERDERQDPAVVDELDVDLALVADPVVGLEPREADRPCLDERVRRVDGDDAGAAAAPPR
ncbi:MAG: hypothetical protein QOF04_2876 [Solirubrobacteraceae bacterium]|jgi:hypothetical protein|nr:hypothetical protein [Solirubrobacteraceae bacterium]